jgi:hypothetical protein
MRKPGVPARKPPGGGGAAAGPGKKVVIDDDEKGMDLKDRLKKHEGMATINPNKVYVGGAVQVQSNPVAP